MHNSLDWAVFRSTSSWAFVHESTPGPPSNLINFWTRTKEHRHGYTPHRWQSRHCQLTSFDFRLCRRFVAHRSNSSEQALGIRRIFPLGSSCVYLSLRMCGCVWLSSIQLIIMNRFILPPECRRRRSEKRPLWRSMSKPPRVSVCEPKRIPLIARCVAHFSHFFFANVNSISIWRIGFCDFVCFVYCCIWRVLTLADA